MLTKTADPLLQNDRIVWNAKACTHLLTMLLSSPSKRWVKQSTVHPHPPIPHPIQIMQAVRAMMYIPIIYYGRFQCYEWPL